MSYVEYFRRRIRYSGFTRLVLDILAKVGIFLRPFILFRESDSGSASPDPGPESGNEEVRFLQREDMHLLAPYARHPGRDIPNEVLYQRLEAGNQCLALFLDGELAAFSWYDLERCPFPGYPFELGDNEAYLFDAYTPVQFRGRGLVPRVRQITYRELARQGRDVYYSFSGRHNRPAVRFKEKLGAERVVTGLYVELFSRWHFRFFIRKLVDDAP